MTTRRSRRHRPRSPALPVGDAGGRRRAERFSKRLLKGAGFTVHRMTFSEPGTADVENLYARIGTARRI